MLFKRFICGSACPALLLTLPEGAHGRICDLRVMMAYEVLRMPDMLKCATIWDLQLPYHVQRKRNGSGTYPQALWQSIVAPKNKGLVEQVHEEGDQAGCCDGVNHVLGSGDCRWLLGRLAMAMT